MKANAAKTDPRSWSLNRTTVPVFAVGRDLEALISDGPQRRTKLWEIGSTLHCSIVGTCLTTGELRAFSRKFGLGAPDASDHDLHGAAVGAAGRHDLVAKNLQKTLDQRHKLAINQFVAAKDEDDLHRLWRESLQKGDIPGAYWALLTHPLASDTLVRKVFGDVHMLSHMVGAANRADIRRLHQLEEEKAALEETLRRQQEQLRDGFTARDARIRELSDLVAARMEERADSQPSQSEETAPVERLVADLRKQLDLEIRRRERAERRVDELAVSRAREEQLRQSMETLQAELETAEARLAPEEGEAGETAAWSLNGATVLYVGGRTHHIARVRALVEQFAGALIHHDGGVEERVDLLPGLVNRADVVVFPVDCVSHAAMQSLKRACQQLGRPYVALRSSGLTSLLHGLRDVRKAQETAPAF